MKLYFFSFLFVFTFVAACSKSTVPDAKIGVDGSREPMQMVLFNYSFYPDTLDIPLGKDVEFTNKEAAKHCLRIEDLELSKDLEPGEKFTYVFEKEGVFNVTSSCDPARMKATIRVRK